jgi:hypothetical protein
VKETQNKKFQDKKSRHNEIFCAMSGAFVKLVPCHHGKALSLAAVRGHEDIIDTRNETASYEVLPLGKSAKMCGQYVLVT